MVDDNSSGNDEGEEQLEEEVIFLTEKSAVNADGSIKHEYFHSVMRFLYPPYGFIPFFLKSYDKARKKFTIIVLTDKRELDYVPLDYPCVAITQIAAQALVDHRRGSSTKKKEVSMELSNTNVAVEEQPADSSPSQAKKGRAPSDGRTPIRQLAIAGFAEGKGQDDIVAAVKELYPEKEEKKIRSLVSLYRYQDKKKAKSV